MPVSPGVLNKNDKSNKHTFLKNADKTLSSRKKMNILYGMWLTDQI